MSELIDDVRAKRIRFTGEPSRGVDVRDETLNTVSASHFFEGKVLVRVQHRAPAMPAPLTSTNQLRLATLASFEISLSQSQLRKRQCGVVTTAAHK